MKKNQRSLAVLATLVVAAFVSTVPLAQAQPYRADEPPGANVPRGYGPGMMGNYGAGRGASVPG